MKRFKAWIKRGAIASVSVILAIGGCQKLTEAPPHQPQNSEEIRGVWMTHVGNAFYAGIGQLDDVFHQLSRLNFNRVYISVYNDGVTYPSKVAHRTREAYIPGYNFLNSAVHQGNRQGLKVYGWFEYGLMLHKNDPIAIAHPDWLLDQGQMINGFVWLDPGHPEVEQYFLALFTEFAYLYHKLDGIQLDDHWAIPRALGDYTTELTHLTAAVATAVKQINPHWIISLSPNPPDFAARRYSQDWLEWVYRGYIDEVVVQVYRPTAQDVATTLTHSGLEEARRYVPVGVGLYTGYSRNSLEITPLAEVARQVDVVLDRGYGYSLFTYGYTFSFLRLAPTKTKESFFQDPFDAAVSEALLN
ncbi:MAG: glycoside hydrolase family 10 protein [Elainellaceae cyanobacterium]